MAQGEDKKLMPITHIPKEEPMSYSLSMLVPAYNEEGLLESFIRKTVLKKLYRPLTPRWQDKAVFEFLEYYWTPWRDKILNIGSGNTRLRDDMVNMDIAKHKDVDVLGDAHQLPFRNGSFDLVFCNAVLEHLKQPWVAANEMERVLLRNGVMLIQAPFLEAVHDEYDYFRFTKAGLRSLFPNCIEIMGGVSAGCSQMLTSVVGDYPGIVAEGTRLEKPLKLLMSWLARPLQYLPNGRGVGGERYARGVYFIGRKTG